MVPMPASPNEPAAGGRSSRDVLVAPGTVSIWVGRFGDEDALYDYVDFRYPSDGGGVRSRVITGLIGSTKTSRRPPGGGNRTPSPTTAMVIRSLLRPTLTSRNGLPG